MKKRRLLLILTVFLLAGLSLTVFAAHEFLPDVYQGTMLLEVKGEKEWTVPYVGEGDGPDDHYRTIRRESVQITVPSLYIAIGLVADQAHPSVTLASAEYKYFRNGELLEYWDCPEQQVPPLHPLASYGTVVCMPYMDNYYVGCAPITLTGEHGVMVDVWEKEQDTYYTHEIQLSDIPLPESETLSGSRTIDLGDGLQAKLTWDFKPALDQLSDD